MDCMNFHAGAFRRIPKAGDIFTYKNLQFEVVDMDRGRVDKLLVIKREEEE